MSFNIITDVRFGVIRSLMLNKADIYLIKYLFDKKYSKKNSIVKYYSNVICFLF